LIIPETKVNDVRIQHFEVSESESALSYISYKGCGIPPGKYVRLFVGETLMMSNTPEEIRSNMSFIALATGDVLVAGLGLGVILHKPLEREDVKSILVIEKSQDVIDAVLPHIRHPKLEVVCADIFDWKPPKGKKWDTIYFDIWPDICYDNLKEVTKLKRKFARRLRRDNPRAWMAAWQEDYLRYIERKGI